MAINNLVLGGAAAGLMANDPTDSPISTIVGIGLGALVGSSIEVVRRASPNRERRGADSIKIDQTMLNREANKVYTNEDYERSMANQARKHNSVSRLSAQASMREAIRTSQRNGGVINEELQKAALQRANSSIGQWEQSVLSNYKSLSGVDLTTSIGNENALKLIKGQLSSDEISLLVSEGKLNDDAFKTLSRASSRDFISSSRENGSVSFSSKLSTVDMGWVKNKEVKLRGSLSIDRTATPEEKINALKGYLSGTLGHDDTFAIRFATNISNFYKGASIDISDSAISIRMPNGEIIKDYIPERKDGVLSYLKNGNRYEANLFQPFADAGIGSTLGGIEMASLSSDGKSVVISSSITDNAIIDGFTNLEVAGFRGHIEGTPYGKALQELNGAGAYVGPDDGENVVRAPSLDIKSQFAKADNGKLTRLVDTSSLEDTKRIIEKINSEMIRQTGLSVFPSNIRQRIYNVSSLEQSKGIVASLTPHPERTTGSLFRGTIVDLAETSHSDTRRLAEASRALVEQGYGHNLSGTILASIASHENDFNKSIGSAVMGMTLEDGKTEQMLKGIKLNSAGTVRLGQGDFTGTKEQIEKMAQLQSGGSVKYNGGESIGFFGGKEYFAPETVDSFTAHRIENSKDGFRLIGKNEVVTDSRSNSGIKIFGDVKSTSTHRDKREFALKELVDSLARDGSISMDSNGSIVITPDSSHNTERLSRLKQAISRGKTKFSTKEFRGVIEKYAADNKEEFEDALDVVSKKYKDINVRAEDFKTGHTLQGLQVSNFKDKDEVSRARNVIKDVLENSGVDVTKGPDANSSQGIKDLYKAYQETSHSLRAPQMGAQFRDARASLFAAKAIEDPKFSNIGLGTVLGNLSDIHDKMTNRGKSSVVRIDHGDGNSTSVKIGKGQDISAAMADVLKATTKRQNLYSSGAIDYNQMYNAIKADYLGLESAGGGMGLYNLSGLRPGTAALTGESSRDQRISWMALDRLGQLTDSNELRDALSDVNMDAIYEVKARALELEPGKEFSEIFDSDPHERGIQIQDLFHKDETKRLKAFQPGGSLEHINPKDGYVSINLPRPRGTNKEFGDMKSLTIPILDSNMSGYVKLDNGRDATRESTRARRDLLSAMAEYISSKKVGGITEEYAATAYMNAFKNYRQFQKDTATGIKKAAAGRKYKNAGYSTVQPLNEAQQAVFDDGMNKDRVRVFVTEDAASEYGFDRKRFDYQEIGDSGMFRVVDKESKTPVQALFTREPATGPNSVLSTELIVDRNMAKGKAVGMDATIMKYNSGDFDDDKAFLAFTKPGSKDYAKHNAELRRIMKSQAEMIKRHKAAIVALTPKLSEVSKKHTSIKGDDNPTKRLIDNVISGKERDIEAPRVTALHQLVEGSLKKAKEEELAALSRLKLDDDARKAAMEEIRDRYYIANQSAYVMQENTLKSVRLAGRGGSDENLMKMVEEFMAENRSKRSDFSKLGDIIGDFMHSLYKPNGDGTDDIVNSSINTVKKSIGKYGKDVLNNPEAMVGSEFNEADPRMAAIHRARLNSDAGAESLPYDPNSSTINKIEDGAYSVLETLKHNKRKLLLGGAGMAGLAILSRSDTPDPSSPMYNAPVARTSPVLEARTSETSYIKDYGSEPGSVTVNGQMLSGFSDSVVKQNIRGLIQGDSNQRSTVRFENRSY